MEALSPAAQRELKPLKYHNDLAEYLKQEEPQVWDWATSANVRLQQSEEMREAMLRQTYRLGRLQSPLSQSALLKGDVPDRPTERTMIAIRDNVFDAQDRISTPHFTPHSCGGRRALDNSYF